MKIKISAYFISALFLLAVLSYSLNRATDHPVYKESFYEQQVAARHNPFSILLSNAHNQLASVFSPTAETILTPIEFKPQEHPLTCEIAALRMALNYVGVDVTETELINNIPFSATTSRSAENIWGDPEKGFVGNPDGSVFLGTGYGVYSQPIKNLALKYSNATIIKNATLSEVLQYASQDRAVIVWGLLSNRYVTYWASYDDTLVTAYAGEHARVLMGYSGDISNPEEIILMDPLYGKIAVPTDEFLSEWKVFDNMSVIVS